MLYRCWYYGHDINPRTYGDKYFNTWKSDIEDKNIGKYILHNHKTFCSKDCILEFDKLNL